MPVCLSKSQKVIFWFSYLLEESHIFCRCLHACARESGVAGSVGKRQAGSRRKVGRRKGGRGWGSACSLCKNSPVLSSRSLLHPPSTHPCPHHLPTRVLPSPLTHREERKRAHMHDGWILFLFLRPLQLVRHVQLLLCCCYKAMLLLFFMPATVGKAESGMLEKLGERHAGIYIGRRAVCVQ